MPDYSNLLSMIGYGGPDLQSLFGEFEGPKDVWAGLLEPQFGMAQSALGELPGQRRGMLEQLTSGLQERSMTAGRGILGRSAGAGFAGSGQISQLGALSRRGFEQEAGRGRYGIGQDIMKREAGILGGLSSRVGSFLESLLAGETELAGLTPEEQRNQDINVGGENITTPVRPERGDLGDEWTNPDDPNDIWVWTGRRWEFAGDRGD